MVIPIPWHRGSGEPATRGVLSGTAWLWLPSLGLAALLVDLGRMHAGEHGDSIVPVLVSLQRWTPMYWDQERFGMLIPLLALPFRDPLANLLVQRWIQALAGLASIALLARYALGQRIGWVTGLLGAGALLLLLPGPWVFEYLAGQPYGLSTALCVAGLLAARPRREGGPGRLATGLILCLLGHWSNAVVGVFLVPVALARAATRRLQAAGDQDEDGGRGFLIDLALLGAGLAFGQVSTWLYPVLWGHPRQMDMTVLPVGEWPRSLLALLQSGVKGAGRIWPAALATAALLGLALPWPRSPGETAGPRRSSLLQVGLLVAAAFPNAVAMAALRWVAGNSYHWRYLSPSLVLVQVAVLSLVAEPLVRLRAVAGTARVGSLLLPPLAALAVYGAPSMRVVRSDLDAALGARTEDVLAARCDLVAGDYWSVWPAVWHAGWVAYQRGLPEPYGLTYRSGPTSPLWISRPREALRVCVVRGAEAQAEEWLRSYDLWPVRQVEVRRTVTLVTPAPR